MPHTKALNTLFLPFIHSAFLLSNVLTCCHTVWRSDRPPAILQAAGGSLYGSVKWQSCVALGYVLRNAGLAGHFYTVQ